MKITKHCNIVRLRNTLIVCFIALILLVVEPSIRGKLSFAVTYIEHPAVTSEKITTPYNSQTIDYEYIHVRQKSRAPEFSTIFLFLSGIIGMIVRFIRKSFERLKRLMDICLAIIGLCLALPLLLTAGAIIRLTSKGPIIYKQNRVGRYGQIFRIYKLRTMRINAEKTTGAVWAKENDPRVTPIGKFLRKTHIDEIPQLINVLKGEMSIVGPRPERPEMVRDLKNLILDYEKRLLVRPGITGLAQVWHKYDETLKDVKKKIKYDLLYIRKMCLWADLRILFRTVFVVLIGRGAR
jgi:exopolysaccharide biosynthesis polyprenyl glycosylphosphotransferase